MRLPGDMRLAPSSLPSNTIPADAPIDRQLLEIVRRLCAETHPGQSHTVNLDTSFDADLALDSLARAELMLRIGKAFGVELPEDALAHVRSPRDMLDYLHKVWQPTALVSSVSSVPPGARHGGFHLRSMPARACIGLGRIAAWAYGCYAWSIFLLLVVPLALVIALLHRPSLGRRLARPGARLLFRCAGIRLSAVGMDALPDRPHVLLVNHTSFLDAIVLTALLPASPGYAFAARQEFARQRIFCPLLHGLGIVLVERHNARRRISNVGIMTRLLRKGQNLVVFPEGMFSGEPGVKPFHSGAFIAAAKANVPVVVAGLQGARAALRPGTWLPRRVPIRLEIGPVLMPRGTDPASVEQVIASARKAMVPLSGEPDNPSA